MLHKFYIENDGKISEGLTESDFVNQKMQELSCKKFSDDVDFTELKNYDIWHNYDNGTDEIYSIQFGAFTEFSDGRKSLEEIFNTLEDAWKDRERYCFDELEDILYTPFVHVEVEEMPKNNIPHFMYD